MNSSKTKLAAYCAVLTAGVALMLVGLRWLFFLGLALTLLSSFFSSRRFSPWKPLLGLLVCLAYAAWVFMQSCREGTAFSREPLGALFTALFAGFWLIALVLELLQRRAAQRSQNVA